MKAKKLTPVQKAHREFLVKENQEAVRSIAFKICRRLPKLATTHMDEVVSSGQLGLVKALDAYDPDRGVQFTTYASQRIRGEILDDLRRLDHLSRSHRAEIKQTGEEAPIIGYWAELTAEPVQFLPTPTEPLDLQDEILRMLTIVHLVDLAWPKRRDTHRTLALRLLIDGDKIHDHTELRRADSMERLQQVVEGLQRVLAEVDSITG